jgi:LacI family transcriptional regulator
MPVRMKDIARELGLSVVTVSKVLRNHPDIAERTRERVLQRVKELDYRPNVLARSLVTGRSYLIGLVVPDLMHPFFAEIAKALSAAVRGEGYSLIISASEEDSELEAREIETLLARRLDALVIASSGLDARTLDQIDRMEQPYILIDRDCPGVTANFVGMDDEAAGRLATQHLIDQGCRRIAHIRGRNNSTGRRRFEGYRQMLAANGLPYSEDLVVVGSTVEVESQSHGAEAMRRLLRERLRPDAVFCFNDPLAIGAMKVILEAGLRIPEDIAIIGCGNLHYDDALSVPLSSIDQKSQMVGEKTAAILLNIFASKARPEPVRIVLDPALVARTSSLRKAEPAAPTSVRRGKEKHTVQGRSL